MYVEELVLELLCFDQIATLGLDNLAVSHPSLKNTGRKKPGDSEAQVLM
jgi:hypothetical protein